MSHKRGPDEWALRIQLEKEEEHNAELQAENKLLKERIAHLEAERYSRNVAAQYAQVGSSGLGVSERAIRAAFGLPGPMMVLPDPSRALGGSLSAAVDAAVAKATVNVEMSIGGPICAAQQTEQKPAPTRWNQLEID